MASESNFTEYLAPYHRLPLGQTTKRSDITFFHEGHTLEKHRQFIGKTNERFRGRYQKYVFQRERDDDELELVLRDPGVEKVVQVTREMEKAIRKADRAVVTFPGSRAAPGYMVTFTDDSYTVDEHFARIGEKIDSLLRSGPGSYAVDFDLPETKLEKIFTDPNVYIVEQNTYIDLL